MGKHGADAIFADDVFVKGVARRDSTFESIHIRAIAMQRGSLGTGLRTERNHLRDSRRQLAANRCLPSGGPPTLAGES